MEIGFKKGRWITIRDLINHKVVKEWITGGERFDGYCLYHCFASLRDSMDENPVKFFGSAEDDETFSYW
eukprot:316555-Heterocapsa_arctica.AAC.1